jgi:signal transduction histidine kinase/ActR/RegA family two-component response regulator/HAMP domain-containing protein
MSASLQKRVTVFITLVILIIGAVSTYLFTSAFSRSKERGLVLRGTALTYSLSKAAEEGLAKEDLSLIKKAAHIIQAPDVTLAQVYSNIWEAVDAYPQTDLKRPPRPEAIDHFKSDAAPFHIRTRAGYDFYSPIFYKAREDAPPTTIGFVRLTLSSAAFQREARQLAAANIAISVLIMIFAIVSLNVLIRRIVVRPVMALHRTISQFKNGVPAGGSAVPPASAGEIRELALEFNRMCETVKENECKLIESDRRIRSLFDRVEHAIFRTDPRGEISEANSRFRGLFGNVTGLCDVLIGDIDAATCLTKAAAEKALHIEDKAVGMNGEELTVSLSLYPERNAAGEITGFDGYIIDVTEKKRLEERLMRSQKLESVGTLAAGMAHDFNNLLTAILGYSGIMLKTVVEGDPFHKPITVIHDAAKRGAELGKKILTVTRKEKRETKPVNLNEIVTYSLDLLQRGLPRNIEVIKKLDDNLPLTKADPSQLQQMIINLAVNARDAMPDGGKLVLETAVVGHENGTGGNGHESASGFIKLSVSDTGMGIDSDTQARIFDPFFTTKEVGKGTGLGLYIVHSIISNHGGYINLYSEPGKGTRFNLYLPIEKGDAEETPRAVDVRGAGTVLVIDDEPDVRELCKDVLGLLGYTVLLAESGSAGINLYRERRDDICLVILDIIMPKMGGTEVFHALRTINKDVKVLLYSGYGHNNFAGIDELLKRGAAGFVEKPFTSQDIGMAIKNALAG